MAKRKLSDLLDQQPILESVLAHLTQSDVHSLAMTSREITPSMRGTWNPIQQSHSIRKHLIRCGENLPLPDEGAEGGLSDTEFYSCPHQASIYCRASSCFVEPAIDRLGLVKLPPHGLCVACRRATDDTCNQLGQEQYVFSHCLLLALCADCCIEEELAESGVFGTCRCITQLSGPGQLFLCENDRRRIRERLRLVGILRMQAIASRRRNAEGEWKQANMGEFICPCGKHMGARERGERSTMNVCVVCDTVIRQRRPPNGVPQHALHIAPGVPHSQRIRDKINDERERLGPRRHRQVLKFLPKDP